MLAGGVFDLVAPGGSIMTLYSVTGGRRDPDGITLKIQPPTGDEMPPASGVMRMPKGIITLRLAPQPDGSLDATFLFLLENVEVSARGFMKRER